LNIIARGRWVRLYLRYYLGLVEDDRCSIPENNLLPSHLATQEEELSKISNVSFECLSTLLRQGVEGGFEDIVIVEVEYTVVRVFTLHA
jgi:hypothetical protein